MNMSKLQQAENQFFIKFPGGFLNPEMLALGKKHRMDKMIELTQDSFKKTRFRDYRLIAENMIKVVSRSSMVSMFEKPKFRDYVNSLSDQDLKKLSNGLKDLLHGNQERGFNAILEILTQGKLAKWSIITIIPNYYFPNDEVFVKPTTAKGVIDYFELEDLQYKPRPSWEFYQLYRETILRMKTTVDVSLTPNNAAFCGFLMMSLHA